MGWATEISLFFLKECLRARILCYDLVLKQLP